MRFARIVFMVAGIWGIVVLTPFYWLVDVTGRPYDSPTTAGQMLRLVVPGKSVQPSGPPPQRKASRDSLRNGAVIGAVIGAAALGATAATLCHVHRERGGASCMPDAIRFAATGAAIGVGAGVVIDVARSSSPMVRLTIAF